MVSRQFIMNLAKLMIAAAWADGTLSNEEKNSLKDLMFSFPELSDHEWTILNMYMDAPVSTHEAESLLHNVISEIRTDEDKNLVIGAISRLLKADGTLSAEEEDLLHEINDAVRGKKTGLFPQFGGLIGRAITKRSEQYRLGTQREEQIDDYLTNKIFFQLNALAESKGLRIDMPEEQLRTLCLAAGLMARIAWVDREITDDEKSKITDILVSEWNLANDTAQFITNLSCSSVMQGLDYYRLTRTFYDQTSKKERKEFLKTLFLVANSAEKTDLKEIEEIRVIAETLHLEHRDFIDAKLSIPDDDRKGL